MALRVKRTAKVLLSAVTFPFPPSFDHSKEALAKFNFTRVKMGKKMCRADGCIKPSRKPHFESTQSHIHRNISKVPKASKILPFGALLLLLLLSIMATVIKRIQDDGVGFSHHLAPFVDWEQRQEAVRDAFVTSWDAYTQHAWGRLPELPA